MHWHHPLLFHVEVSPEGLILILCINSLEDASNVAKLLLDKNANVDM